jgi:hypothetical protein
MIVDAHIMIRPSRQIVVSAGSDEQMLTDLLGGVLHDMPGVAGRVVEIHVPNRHNDEDETAYALEIDLLGNEERRDEMLPSVIGDIVLALAHDGARCSVEIS